MLGLAFVILFMVVLGLVLHRAIVPRRVLYRRSLRPYVVSFCLIYTVLVLLVILTAFNFATTK